MGGNLDICVMTRIGKTTRNARIGCAHERMLTAQIPKLSSCATTALSCLFGCCDTSQRLVVVFLSLDIQTDPDESRADDLGLLVMLTVSVCA